MINKMKSMSQLQRQMIIIGLCVAFFAVLAAIYFFILQPIIEKMGQKEEVHIELLDGEEIGIGNRIMITRKYERGDIKNVQVKNKEDHFKLIHHLGQNYYYVEGAELVQINGETVASFFTNVSYLLSMERVAAKDIEDGNEILENLEPFGLNPDNPDVYFVVTTIEDVWYKIIIGDKIPTTGGYYVMFEDKDGVRPAIYILDTMMEETILSTRYSIMLPLIAIPIPQNETYLIDNFKFYKGRDLMVDIYNAPIPEGSEALVNWQMRYPAPYDVSDRYSSLTMSFVYFAGERVVYAFGIDDEIDEDILTKFGFDEVSARITFDFHEKEYDFIFSKKNENGNYYVISMDFYSIVEISPENERMKMQGELQPFVEWDLLKFVNKPIFGENINDVETIEIKVPGKGNAFFELEGVGQELEVKGNGVDLIVNGGFRDLYYSILSIDLEDYATETEIYEEKDPMLEMIITTRDGLIRHYKFYFVEETTRRCYFSINGAGDFYVLRDKVLKLMNDTEKILQNLPIDREARE